MERPLKTARFGGILLTARLQLARTSLPAVRRAIVELIAQRPPQRCPYCRRWICAKTQRE
jgi:hypothetical protein